jgi:hypothetical protein
MSAKTPGRAGLALSAALALAVVPTTDAFAAAPATPRAVAFIGAHGFPTVQAALDASHDGDAVTVSPGTFPGGIRIAHSVTLRGAGAGRTVFRGGEHVVTVGTVDAPAGSEPRVTIAGVTVTGGIARTNAWPGDTTAEGGGIYVLPDLAGVGAHVTLTDSIVSGNRTEPAALTQGEVIGDDLSQYNWDENDLRERVCPGHRICNSAGSFGAGIATYGDLDLVRSSVSGNTAGGALASDVWGGGIVSWPGSTLTATDSHIDGNTVVAAPPEGRFAEGGGVFAGYNVAVKLTRTTVNGNTAKITTTFPMSYDDYPQEFQPLYTETGSNGAGIHLDFGASIELRASHVDRNTLSSDAPNSQFGALNAAIQMNGGAGFVMVDSTADYNTADTRVYDGQYTGAWDGIVQLDTTATISRSSVSHNAQTVTARQGIAWANAALVVLLPADGSAAGTATVTDSVIVDNKLTAISPHDGAVIAGVGLVNDANVTLTRTRVTGNAGIGRTVDGTATRLLGGGISNGADGLFPGYANPNAQLALTDSTVAGNSLTSTARGAEIVGAGIHSLSPVALTRSTVRGNAPDDCDACAGAAPGHGPGHPSPHPHWPWRVDHDPHEWGHHSR